MVRPLVPIQDLAGSIPVARSRGTHPVVLTRSSMEEHLPTKQTVWFESSVAARRFSTTPRVLLNAGVASMVRHHIANVEPGGFDPRHLL